MGHLQGIEDCSEVRIFRPCIPRINIKNIKPPFFRKHLNVSDDEERTCSWTPRYRFLLIRVCQWWMLDQSPSKIQRSRVQSDRVGLHSTSYAPWLMTDIIEGILTENVRTVMLNTDHQHKSYIWGNPGDCSGSFFFDSRVVHTGGVCLSLMRRSCNAGKGTLGYLKQAHPHSRSGRRNET